MANRMANNTRFPETKHGKRYWLKRVYRPEIKRKNGSRDTSPNYAVRLSYAGRSKRLSLETPNQEAAADKAREMFVFLTANGWAAFLTRYRGPHQSSRDHEPVPGVKTNVSVGDFLGAVRMESDLSEKAFKDYAVCFRFILSEIRSLEKTKSRYGKKGRTKWTAVIEAILLSSITPDKVRAWKRAYIERAGRDELARKRFSVSCNSYLRRARSLFSKRNVLDKLKSIRIPDVLPFDGVQLEPRADTKFYGAGVDAMKLVRAAIKELGDDRTEELKVFLLAITLGLRRREIDLLEWDSFDFERGTLHIRPTKWYKLKTRESAVELPVETEILALFRGWRARATAEFVLESLSPPKAVSYQFYRCEETFQALLGWIRGKGVQEHKPLHTLRKLYGSALADLHGLHAASAGLRHSDIKTTHDFYADRRVKVTPGFGSAISGASVSEFEKGRPFSRRKALNQPTRRSGGEVC
jgi:integrase